MINIKETKNKLTAKVASLIEDKRAKLIEKISTSSSVSFFLNWLLTNWVSVLIVLIVSFFGLKYYLQLRNVEEQLLRQQIENLNADLEKAKIEKEKLLVRIKDLDKTKENNKKETKKISKEVEKLSIDKKKETLLSYKDRLVRRRGL